MTIGCAVMFGAPKARAQTLFDRDQSMDVQARPHPEYDPIGIRAGAFVAHPEVTAGAAVNDNILPSDAETLRDVAFSVAPAVKASSDWSQHALNASASAIIARYASHPHLDSDQYAFSADGRLDVRRDLTVTAQASQARILLPTTSDEYLSDIQSALLYDETHVSVGGVRQSSRIKLSLTGTYERYAYLDGRTTVGQAVDEHFRDRDTYIGDVRGDYAISPDLAVFVEEVWTHNNYDRARLRDQGSAETLIGPNFQINHLIVGEIGVGYLTGSFSGPGARWVGTLHGRGKIAYYATPLITVTLTGHQGFIDSGVPTSPAYLNRNVELKTDYELLRNLIVSLKQTANWNDYTSIERHDRYYGVGLHGTYLANRGLNLVLAFDHISRSSSGTVAGRRFDDNTLSLSFRLKQ